MLWRELVARKFAETRGPTYLDIVYDGNVVRTDSPISRPVKAEASRLGPIGGSRVVGSRVVGPAAAPAAR